MPTKNILEFRSVSAWNVSFAHSLHASLQSAQVAEPKLLTTGRTRDLQTGTVFIYNAGFLAKHRSCRFVTI